MDNSTKSQTIKPKRFDLNVIYQCPICNHEFWFNPQQLKIEESFTCCGHTFHTQPIKKTTLNIKFNTEIPKKAIKILKGYGFSKQEITKSDIDTDTTEDFIRQFLASQNN